MRRIVAMSPLSAATVNQRSKDKAATRMQVIPRARSNGRALPEGGWQAQSRCRCGISLESSSGQRFLFRLGRRPDCLDPCRTRRPVCEPGRSQRLVRLEFRRGLAHGRAPRWLDSRRIEGWLGIHGPRPHPQRITLLGRHQRSTGKLLGLIRRRSLPLHCRGQPATPTQSSPVACRRCRRPRARRRAVR